MNQLAPNLRVDSGQELGFGTLVGRVDGLDGAEVRIIVEGEDLRWEIPASRGAFRLERLEPGKYRVELRSDRLVIAKRIDITPGPNAVTLTVHENAARRLGLVVAMAPVIPLPTANFASL